MQRKRSEEQAETAKLEAALDEVASELRSLQEGREREYAERSTISADVEKLKAENDIMRARCERLEIEKTDLQRALERRQVDADGLATQVEAAANKLKELREMLLKREGELCESQGRMASAMRQTERAQDEVEKYRKQASWSAEELERTSHDFASYRQQKSGELATLQAQLEIAEQAVVQKSEQVERLRGSLRDKESKLEELLVRIRDAETTLADREAIFVQEMDAKTRLAELYKDAMEDGMARLEETELLLASIQNSSVHVDEQIRKIESAADARIVEIEAQLHEKEAQVEQLCQHLGTSSNSPRLTDLYADYANVRNELLASKQETGRLKGCIQDICTDLEARAPVLQAERREKERLKQDVVSMSHQLLLVSQARDESDSRARNLEAVLRETRGSKVLLERQVKDLGKQVQSLLAEMEGVARPGDQAGDEMCDVVDADQVIDERLVVFRNIQELQVRNQELVRVLRELSEQQETAELARLQHSEEELRQLLDANAAELAELREHRQKQTVLVESLVRQRDMLREMLNSAQQQQQQQIVPTTSASPNPDSRVEDLRAEYEMYKEEKTESLRYLESLLDKSQAELSEMRTRCAQAEAQLAFAQERRALLQESYTMEHNELTALRQSHGAAMAMLTQHQSQMQHMLSELMSAKDSQQRLASQLASHRVELEMTKAQALRTNEQAETLQQEKDRLSQLLSALQAMAAEQEGTEVTLKQHLSEQIDSLTRELLTVRQAMAQEVESHRLAMAVADREYRDVVRRHEQIMENYNRVREEAAQSKMALAETTKRLSDLEILQKRSDERFAQLMGPTTNANGHDGEDPSRETTALRAQIEAIRDELRLEQEHSQTYQQMARTAEQNLLELTHTHDEFKDNAEHRIQQLSSKEADLLAQLDAQRQQSHDLQQQLSGLHERHASQIDALQGKLAQLQEYADMAASHSLLRKEDVDHLQSMVQESKQRYEQEVVAHARDLERLHELQAEALEHQKQLFLLTDNVAVTKEQLMTSEALLAGARSRHQEETAAIQRRLVEVESQNNILMGQLEALTSRASRRASGMGTANGATSVDTLDQVEEADESAGMLQVVKYLRRQKEILQLEHDAMSGEYRRVKSQCETLNRSLDEARALLAEERNSNQWQAQMAGEYRQLLEKVEHLNILRESNSTLRQEADNLTRRVKDLEARLEEANGRLEPVEREGRLLAARIASGEEEMRLLRGDRDNWKRRFEQILEKTRLDPADLEKLQTEIQELQETISHLTTANQEAQSVHKDELAQKTLELEAALNRLSQLETKHKDLLVKTRQIIKTRDELSLRITAMEKEAADKTDAAVPFDQTAFAELQADHARVSAALVTAEAKLSTLRLEFAEKTSKLEKYTEAFAKVSRIREKYKEAQEQLHTLTEQLRSAEQRVQDVKKESEMRGALLNANWQAKVRKLEAEIARLGSGNGEPISKKAKTEAETTLVGTDDRPHETADHAEHEQGADEEDNEDGVDQDTMGDADIIPEESDHEDGEDEGESEEEGEDEGEGVEEGTNSPTGPVNTEDADNLIVETLAAPLSGLPGDEDEFNISDLEDPASTVLPNTNPSAVSDVKPSPEIRSRGISMLFARSPCLIVP